MTETAQGHPNVRRLMSRFRKPQTQFMETANLFEYFRNGIIFWKEFFMLVKFMLGLAGIYVAVSKVLLPMSALGIMLVVLLLHILSTLTDVRIRIYPSLVRSFLSMLNIFFCTAFTTSLLGLVFMQTTNLIAGSVAVIVVIALAYIFRPRNKGEKLEQAAKIIAS